MRLTSIQLTPPELLGLVIRKRKELQIKVKAYNCLWSRHLWLTGNLSVEHEATFPLSHFKHVSIWHGLAFTTQHNIKNKCVQPGTTNNLKMYRAGESQLGACFHRNDLPSLLKYLCSFWVRIHRGIWHGSSMDDKGWQSLWIPVQVPISFGCHNQPDKLCPLSLQSAAFLSFLFPNSPHLRLDVSLSATVYHFYISSYCHSSWAYFMFWDKNDCSNSWAATLGKKWWISGFSNNNWITRICSQMDLGKKPWLNYCPA